MAAQKISPTASTAVGVFLAQKSRMNYGTLSEIVALLLSVPEAPVTTMLYCPAGVPLTGVGVVPLLHAGCSTSNPNKAHSIRIQRCAGDGDHSAEAKEGQSRNTQPHRIEATRQ